LFALEFVGAGELPAEEFEEAAGARAAIGAEQAHAVEEDEELEDFGVFWAALGSLRGGLFGFIEEGGKGVVESALDGSNGRLLVDDAGSERLVGFGERLQRGQDIGVGGGGLSGAKFSDREGHGGKKLRVDAYKIRSDANIEKQRVRGKLARVLVFVAVRGEEVCAVGRAVESDLALGAAADGADGFGLCRAESTGFAFLTDRTGQVDPLERGKIQRQRRPPPESGPYKSTYLARQNITP